MSSRESSDNRRGSGGTTAAGSVGTPDGEWEVRSEATSGRTALTQAGDEGEEASLEDVFLEYVEANLVKETEAMLWKRKHEVRVDAQNELGQTALALACMSGSLDMMKVIIAAGAQIREEVLICIEQNFKPGLVFLLDRLNFQNVDVINQPVTTGRGIFPAGATAVKVASSLNNIEILKLLKYYGAQPIPVPTAHQSSLDKSNNLQNSEETYFTMTALASPAYALVIANDDPVMTAFKMSAHCRRFASTYNNLKNEYKALSEKMEDFAANWLGQANDNYEVDVILSLERDGGQKVSSKPDKYARVRYALHNDHKKFVSHPYCQQVLAKNFDAGLPSGWRDKPVTYKILVTILLALTAPAWVLFYWLVPPNDYILSEYGVFLEFPYMKLIVNMELYLLIQIALILTKNHFDSYDWLLNDDHRMLRDLGAASQASVQTRPGDSMGVLNVYIIIWTFGNIWSVYRGIKKNTAKAYFSDGHNVTTFIMTLLFLVAAIINIVVFWFGEADAAEARSDQSEFEWDVLRVPEWVTNLQQGQEIALVFGNLFLFQKLIYWMRINSVFGKTYFLATVSLGDVFNFFIIFLLFYFAFIVCLNGMLWPTYAAVLSLCHRVNVLGEQRADILSGKSPAARSAITKVLDFDCRKLNDAGVGEKDEWFMRESISVYGMAFQLLIALFGSSSENNLVAGFYKYTSPQELWGALVFAFYTFFMILVRLNVLIALIVSALSQVYTTINTQYKFQRSEVIIPFTDPEDDTWIPSPLNLVPNMRTVTRLVQRTCYKSSPDTVTDALKDEVRRENREGVKRSSEAAKAVIRDMSGRMLRMMAKEQSNRPATVDDVGDTKVSLGAPVTEARAAATAMETQLLKLLRVRNKRFDKTMRDKEAAAAGKSRRK